MEVADIKKIFYETLIKTHRIKNTVERGGGRDVFIFINFIFWKCCLTVKGWFLFLKVLPDRANIQSAIFKINVIFITRWKSLILSTNNQKLIECRTHCVSNLAQRPIYHHHKEEDKPNFQLSYKLETGWDTYIWDIRFAICNMR